MPPPAFARHAPVCPGPTQIDGKRTCRHCGNRRPEKSFPLYSGSRGKRGLRQSVCNVCLSVRSKDRHARLMSDPVSRHKEATLRRDWDRKFYAANPWARKTRAYQRADRELGRKTITRSEARAIIVGASCFYCGLNDDRFLGLDRMDNFDGHHLGNVKVCCEVCNFILSDLPFQAKVVVGRGLKTARQRGLLDGYVIPIKRKKESRT